MRYRRSITIRLTIMMVSFMIVSSSLPVLAISQDQRSVFDSGVSYFNVSATNDCSASSGGGGPINISNNKNYKGDQILSDDQLKKIGGMRLFYEKAASKHNIPWQLLAVIHILENDQRRNGPKNGQGPFQDLRGNWPVKDYYGDEEFQRAADRAAEEARQKLGNRDVNNDDNVKYLLFGYNGRARAYIDQARKLGFSEAQAMNGEGSPYVMNRADARRDPTTGKTGTTWGQIKTDHGGIKYPANEHFGSFVMYKALMSVKGSSSGGQSGSTNGADTDVEANESCGPSLSGSANENIARVAREMGQWGLEHDTCYAQSAISQSQVDESIKQQFRTTATAIDCSGFVSAVIYKATGTPFVRRSSFSINEDRAHEFIKVSVTDARPGDIMWRNVPAGHVAIMLEKNSDGTYTVAQSSGPYSGCGRGYGPTISRWYGKVDNTTFRRYKGAS